jgi:hypothetical protein
MAGPNIPDPNKAAIQGANAQAANFPFEYIINQLAQLGGSADVNGKNYDFTGLGTADNAAAMSDQTAKALLDIQKNYGADFVKQRIADLQQSDPQGFADRKELFDRILADSQKAAPNAGMSKDLQDAVNNQLNTGGQLTGGPGGELEQVQQAVRGKQIANGITLGNAPAEQEAAAVEGASEQKRSQVQSTAQQYLAAGISPEDIQYRKIQQDLENLGAFESGTTPEAQFASLSGAGNGAAPSSAPYSNTAAIDPNAALAQAMQLYSGQVNWSQQQVNPWTAGLSTLGGLGNVAAGLGWKPFAPSTTPNVPAMQPVNAWAGPDQSAGGIYG